MNFKEVIKIISLRILVPVIVVLSAGACFGKTVVKIGYVEFPPMTFTNSDNKPDGILITMADKILSRLHYPWKAYSFPAKRLAKSIAKGHVDLWIGLATLPAFKGTTFIGKMVVCKLRLNAYTIGDNPPIHLPDDLFDETIIIIRGYSYGGWIKTIKDPANHIDFIEVNNNHKEAFSKLVQLKKRHRNAYLLDYQYPSEAALKTTPIHGMKTYKIDELDVHFVVSRKTRNAEKLLDQLEKEYKRYKENGEI